jgi:membrane associated rhomboid family serine protease
MVDNTMISQDNILAHRYWTLVTAAFSQSTFDHLLINMGGLAALTPTFCKAGGVGIGAAHIVGLTIGSALLSDLAYIIYRWKSPTRLSCADPEKSKREKCEGGAGAIGIQCAFITGAACLRPWSSYTVGPFRLPSWMACLGACFFVTDCMMFGQDDNTGHEVHLAGALFGIVYFLVALRKPYGVWLVVSHGADSFDVCSVDIYINHAHRTESSLFRNKSELLLHDNCQHLLPRSTRCN